MLVGQCIDLGQHGLRRAVRIGSRRERRKRSRIRRARHRRGRFHRDRKSSLVVRHKSFLTTGRQTKSSPFPRRPRCQHSLPYRLSNIELWTAGNDVLESDRARMRWSVRLARWAKLAQTETSLVKTPPDHSYSPWFCRPDQREEFEALPGASAWIDGRSRHVFPAGHSSQQSRVLHRGAARCRDR